MRKLLHLGLMTGAAAVLTACGGGGGGSDDPVPTTPTTPAPGASQLVTLNEQDTTAANGINGIVHAADGSIYAIGVSDGADQQTVILGYNPDGSVNNSFGNAGVMTLNVRTAGMGMGDASSGNEQGFGIVELEDGDLVIVVNAADGNGTTTPEVAEGQSVYLFRLDADNDFAVMAGYGDDGGSNGLLAGAQEVVFATANTDNAAYLTAAGILPNDAATDMLLDTSGSVDRLVVLGSGSAPMDDAATDQDRYVARLTASNGLPDNGFNGGVAHQYSTPRSGSGPSTDNVRRGFVEADGSIMSAGYTDLGSGLGNHIILIKLLENGMPDMEFGDFFQPSANTVAGVAGPGIAAFNPFVDAGGFVEAYAAAPQSNGDYITSGYGAANNGTVPASGPLSNYAATDMTDLVTFRVANGASDVDQGYGNPQAPGTQAIQSEGDNSFTDGDELRTEERGRDMVVLDDDRSIHVGYYGGVPALYVLTADGQLDTSVDDDGLILLPHTPDNTSGEVLQQFFTVELSADQSRLAVGTRGIDPNGARLLLFSLGDSQ